MADPHDTDPRLTGAGSPPRMPRWVKVSGIVVGVFVVILVILQLTGPGGQHGPGRHGPGLRTPRGDGEPDSPPVEGAAEPDVAAARRASDPDRIELPAGIPVNVALSASDTLRELAGDDVGFPLEAADSETAVPRPLFGDPGVSVGYCSVPRRRETGTELEFFVIDSGRGPAPPVGHG